MKLKITIYIRFPQVCTNKHYQFVVQICARGIPVCNLKGGNNDNLLFIPLNKDCFILLRWFYH